MLKCRSIIYNPTNNRSIFNHLCFNTSQVRNSQAVAMKPILYGDEASPPVRFVLMTASVLDIDLEFHKIDLFKSENKTESYKKINPLQKVPALSVAGEVICDSHAIALYFCQRTKNHDLYPRDALMMAKVNEMLFFNSSVLFPTDSDIFTEYFAGQWPLNKTKVSYWFSSLDYLECQLSKQKWLAGDKMQLCDLCCYATVSSLNLLVPVLERHVKVKNWMKNLEIHSCFNINMRGLERLQSFIQIIKPDKCVKCYTR